MVAVYKLVAPQVQHLMEIDRLATQKINEENEEYLLKEISRYDLQNQRLQLENEMHKEKEEYLLSEIAHIVAKAPSLDYEKTIQGDKQYLEPSLDVLEHRNAELQEHLRLAEMEKTEKMAENVLTQKRLDESMEEVKQLTAKLLDERSTYEELSTEMLAKTETLRVEVEKIICERDACQKDLERKSKEINGFHLQFQDLKWRNKELESEILYLRAKEEDYQREILFAQAEVEELKGSNEEQKQEILQLRTEQQAMLKEKRWKDRRLNSLISMVEFGDGDDSWRKWKAVEVFPERALSAVKHTAGMVRALEGDEKTHGRDESVDMEDMIQVFDAELEAIWRGYLKRVKKIEEMEKIAKKKMVEEMESEKYMPNNNEGGALMISFLSTAITFIVFIFFVVIATLGYFASMLF